MLSALLRKQPSTQSPGGGTSGSASLAFYLTVLLLLFSFFKFPVLFPRNDTPQAWEAVLAYAAFHHLQWGKEIVFTFGPLGFLGSDYYWGYLFWPTWVWAIWFRRNSGGCWREWNRPTGC